MSRIESGRMTLRKEEFLFGSVIELKIMTQSQCRDKGLEFEFINSCDPEEWYFGDDTKLKHEPYNLVFVDRKMPDRNGLDITREINKEYRDEAKIIMLTAYSGDDIMEDAIAAGADGFITKSAFSTIAKSEIEKVMLREKSG